MKYNFALNQLIINNIIIKFLKTGHTTPDEVKSKFRINKDVIKYDNKVICYMLRTHKTVLITDFKDIAPQGQKLQKHIASEARSLGLNVLVWSVIENDPTYEAFFEYFSSLKWN